MSMGFIDSSSGINVVKMLEDHLEPEIQELITEIEMLEDKIYEKEKRLLLLQSLQRRLEQDALHQQQEDSPGRTDQCPTIVSGRSA